MYLTHYNLNDKPFQMSTDPKFLWLGEKHKEALATMKYAILENKGILALTGDVGTGKTTLINALIASLGEDIVAAAIDDPSLEVLDFFNIVADVFNMGRTFDSKAEFLIYFRQFLKKTRVRNQKVLLIIDEAQRISNELLEEIRLLSNLEDEHVRLLNIFFVGQNEFIDILKEYKNRALRQRITVRYHIEPLTLSEAEAYTRHRLKIAGAKAHIFSSGAIQEIFSFSNGYPRLINIICDHALLSGYVRELIIINADIIKECKEELQISDWMPAQDADTVMEPKEEPKILERIPAQEKFYADDDEIEFEREVPVLPPIDRSWHRGIRVGSVVIGIALLVVIGSVAGYDFYNNAKIELKPHTNPALRQREASYPAQAEQKNDIPVAVTAAPEQEAFDVPTKVEIGKDGDSSFFIAKEPEPELFKETTQKKPEALDVTAKVETGEPEGSREPAANVPQPKSFEEITTKDVRTISALPPKRTESAPVVNPVLDKQPDKIKPLISTPSQPSVKPKQSVAIKKVEQSKDTQPKAEPAKAQIQTPLVMSKSFERVPEPEIGSEKDKQQAAGAIETIDSATKKVAMPAKESGEKKVVSIVKEKVVLAFQQGINPASDAGGSVANEDFSYRLKTFLSDYCLAYENMQLEKFAAFFTPDAIEKGQPFSSRLEQYRRSWEKVDSMDCRIEVQRYSVQEGTGLIRIDGIFRLLAKLSDGGKWQQSNARYFMDLEEYGSSFKVKRLDYTSSADQKIVLNPNQGIKPGASVKKTSSHEDMQDRLRNFLTSYCRTYEKKQLEKFAAFFTPDAIEKDKPFSSRLEQYRRNFEKIDSMDYRIELKRYAVQEGTELIRIEGIYYVRARSSGSNKWRENSGQIDMELVRNGDSFLVKRLSY